MNQPEMIIYEAENGKVSVVLYAKDGNIWLSQNQIAELFGTSKQNVSLHIINILKDKELDEDSVVKDYLTTAADGKNYNVTFYSLEMILAIGFRVRGNRGTQFRQWANQNLREYIVKGFVMDDERLKNPDGRPDYYDELLNRIRDIRASEKRFYQKIRDLFALSIDYDKTDKATQMFFAETQNKLLYAITGSTAAEIVTTRADHTKLNMGLTTWAGAIVRKQDIVIAKNYLTADELDSLNRFVSVFLETAELRAKNRQQIKMDFWRENVDRIIEFNDKEVLTDKGSISNAEMEEKVASVYRQFDANRKKKDAERADAADLEELTGLEMLVKRSRP